MNTGGGRETPSARSWMLGNPDLRRHNLSAVLRAVAESIDSTRSTVAERTGLTKTAVGTLAGQLIDHGILVEEDALGVGIGRPSRRLRLATERFAAISCEIQSTVVRTMVSDLGDDVLATYRQETQGHSPQHLLDVLVAQVRQALAVAVETGRRPLEVVLGVHAAVDSGKGVVLRSFTLDWEQFPLAEALRSALDLEIPVLVEHDATASAIAEFHAADSQVRNLVSISSDLGIGAGLVIEGRPFRGSHGFGADLGHMVLDPEGPLCNCGRAGCWTAFIGMRNAFRRALPDLAAGVEVLSGYESIAREALRTAALNHDERTLSTLHEVGLWLGRGAANAVNIFDPDALVVGGYLEDLQVWVLPSALASFSERVVRELPDPARVFRMSGLGDTRVLIGGRRIVLEYLLNDPQAVMDDVAAEEHVR